MSTAFLFPGQGSQVIGMGRDVYMTSRAARAVFEQADAILDFGLSRLCFEGPESVLTATENAQPAILTTSIALLAALDVDSVSFVAHHATYVAGHSLGEYSALGAIGALDFPTALQLVRRRGELMAAANQGMMAAIIGIDERSLEEICREASVEGAPVVIANFNAPGQLVISGVTEAVERASMLAKTRGAKRVLPLKVSAAFHSPLMSGVAMELAAMINVIQVADTKIPLISNVTAEALRDADVIRDELIAQITAPVRWIESIQHMVSAGVDTFVEIGPGSVLTGLIKRIAPAARLVNVNNAESTRALLMSIQG